MQSLARRQVGVHHCFRFFLNEFKRSLCSSSNTALSDPSPIGDLDSAVLVESNACSKTVVLNRPSFLNALSTYMGTRLQKLYKTWEDTPDVGFVVMKGGGRAFCAGGDIVSVYDMIRKGNIEGCKEFFWTLYSFMYLVGTYLKPHVAILDGITMGGGAGVSIPGTFRVATDKTAFATPETLIGFHPDAGASFHLSHLPGYLGEYLGLTGDRLNGVGMMACGLATHYSHSANVLAMEECLKNLITDDPSVIETCLQKYSDLDYPNSSSVILRIETLNKCFSHDTIEEIIDALENEAAKTHDWWCDSTLKKLKYASPLSLKVALRSIREGRFQSFDQCLIREYRMSLQAISGQISSDLYEGAHLKMSFIQSLDTGLVLDVSGKDGIKSGAEVIVWNKKSSNNDNQKWVHDSDGFIHLASNNHLVLDATGGAEAGVKVQLWERKSSNNANQKWKKDGHFLVNQAQQNVLDVKDDKKEPGATLCVWSRKNEHNKNQQWEFHHH